MKAFVQEDEGAVLVFSTNFHELQFLSWGGCHKTFQGICISYLC